MGLILAVLASLFASFNNFAQRRSLDGGGSAKGFVVIQLFSALAALLIVNFLNPESHFILSPTVLILGGIGGLLQGTLTWSVANTLTKGPAGLTFAIMNSASIVPALLFFLFFGPSFGYTYTLWNALGSLLVLVGLFWATKKRAQETDSNKAGKQKGWTPLVLLTFLSHAAILAYFGLWAFIIEGDHPLFSTFNIDKQEEIWFIPVMVFVAGLMQLVLFLKENRFFRKRELFYGMGGGTCQGMATFFLILAAQKASSWENAMLFPAFAVLVIIICNIWSQLLYKENVNWKANSLSFTGIILGTLGS